MKRPGEYVAKEWSEQKVPEIAVIGLYDTHQKCKGLEVLTLTIWEKNGLEFFSKKISKILSIFSPKNRGFLGGQTWAVGKPYHPSNGPSKNIEGLLFEKIEYSMKLAKN